VPRIFCFKHIMKTKILPPYKCILTPSLKIWLRASSNRWQFHRNSCFGLYFVNRHLCQNKVLLGPMRNYKKWLQAQVGCFSSSTEVGSYFAARNALRQMLGMRHFILNVAFSERWRYTDAWCLIDIFWNIYRTSVEIFQQLQLSFGLL